MEWQQLIGFFQVAKLGSFTRAAAATFRTQPALTRQVKALEAELESPLFERLGRRQLRLTAAGEKLFRFTERLFKEYEALKEELSELKGLSKGRLGLAAPFTTLYQLLPETLKGYLDKFPGVELTILDRSQPDIMALIKNGDIDFGLVLESLVPGSLEARRWLKVHTVLMVPRGHPLVGAGPLDLRQIAAYPLILPPRSPEYTGRARLEKLLEKEGLRPQVVMESSSVELSASYVEMGWGLAFATVVEEIYQLQKRDLTFIYLDHFFPPDHIALIMRPDKTLPPYKQAFIDMLLGTE